MLVAYRLAGLSALGLHYVGVRWRATRGDAALFNGFMPVTDMQELNSTPVQAELAGLVSSRIGGRLAPGKLLSARGRESSHPTP